MRPIVGAIIVSAAFATTLVAQETQEDRMTHALHGLITMYSAGSVCFYSKWSFTKPELDEMLRKIKELGDAVPRKTYDDMWAQAHEVLAEGQASANQERCTQVHERYEVGRPFLLEIEPTAPAKPQPQ